MLPHEYPDTFWGTTAAMNDSGEPLGDTAPVTADAVANPNGEADVSMSGEGDRKRTRGKRAGKAHRKRGADSRDSPRGAATPAKLQSGSKDVDPVAIGMAPQISPDAAKRRETDGVREDAPAAASTAPQLPDADDSIGDTDGNKPKHKRRRHRSRGRAKDGAKLLYNEMNVQQRLKFEARDARKQESLARQQVKLVPMDRKGRVRRGVDVQDYRPNAPRLYLPVCHCVFVVP